MTFKTITSEELYQKILAREKVLLLDVRAEEKYNDFHIEGTGIESLNIHKSEIFKLEGNSNAMIEALPKKQEMVVTCTTGNSATKCASILSEHHYDVLVLEGGMTAWKNYLQTK